MNLTVVLIQERPVDTTNHVDTTNLVDATNLEAPRKGAKRVLRPVVQRVGCEFVTYWL
jgi:hypothetical protein